MVTSWLQGGNSPFSTASAFQAEERDGWRTEGWRNHYSLHFTFFSVFLYRVYLEAPPHNICLPHAGCNCPQPSLAESVNSWLSPTLKKDGALLPLPLFLQQTPFASIGRALCILRLKKPRSITGMFLQVCRVVMSQREALTYHLKEILNFFRMTNWPPWGTRYQNSPAVKIHPLISQSMPQGSGSSQGDRHNSSRLTAPTP